MYSDADCPLVLGTVIFAIILLTEHHYISYPLVEG